jgi:hypothetical protein
MESITFHVAAMQQITAVIAFYRLFLHDKRVLAGAQE